MELPSSNLFRMKFPSRSRFTLRGANGDVWVGVRARARLAGGYFFFFSAWYAFLEHTIQNKIKIENNPRARAPELVELVLWGPRAHPNSPRSFFFVFRKVWWMTMVKKIKNKKFDARARTRSENRSHPNQYITNFSP